MNRTVRLCTLLALFVIGGALAPPLSLARNYLLFGSGIYSTHGYVYQMDGEGNLTLSAEPKVTYNCCTIAVSPNGQTVVYSGFTTPTLTVFHIGQDGSLAPPVAVNGLAEAIVNPVTFHPSLPLFYVLTQSATSIYRYDWAAGIVQPTGEHKAISSTSNGGMGYSPWSGRLIFSEMISSYQHDALGSAPLMEDGALSAPGPKLQLPDNSNQGFAVSPDGRWVAVSSLFGLHLVSVSQDGTLSLADTYYFGPDYHIGSSSELAFSPDGRFVYLLDENLYFLVCFEIDPQAGRLNMRSYLSLYDMPVQLFPINGFALTPDGQFAVIFTGHPTLWREGHSMLHVIRLTGDGGMQYLDGKQVDVAQQIIALAFAQLPDKNAVKPQWPLYE